MTKTDFDKIIYELFDNLDTPQSYLEGKRKVFDCLQDEYSNGLKSSFERLRSSFETTTAKTLVKQNEIKRRLGVNISGHLFVLVEEPFYNYLSLKQKTPQQLNQENKPTANEIALLYYYQGKTITLDNVTEIAKKHGFKGVKLYNLYTAYLNNNDRKAAPTTNTKVRFKNKIKLFENVIEMLETKDKQKALTELNILRNLYKSDYQ